MATTYGSNSRFVFGMFAIMFIVLFIVAAWGMLSLT
jgi:hypothetical protein